MDSAEVFLSGLDVFDRVVQATPPEAWTADSPCAGWTALDVLGHVVGVLDVGNQILAGEKPDWSGAPEHPRDVVGPDPVGRWSAAAATARTSVQEVDDLDRVIDSPMGPRPIRDGLSFPAMDLHLHAWDLGRAVGVDVEVAPEVGEFARTALAEVPPEMMRSPGVFGPEVDPPADATPTELLMAWTGRVPR